MSHLDIDEGAKRERGISYLAGKLLLEVMGWTFHAEELPEDLKKCVLIAYPHTSNWDLPLMLACSYLGDMKISWLGKHTLFRGIGGPFFGWLGGVPVDRTAPQGMVQQVVETFDETDEMILAIPPEGTRARTDGWKTGFYYIAHGADVPILMAYLDWKKKEAGFGPLLYPSGDIEADFEILREFYDGKEGCYPEWQGEVAVRKTRRYVKKPKEPGKLGLGLVRDSIAAMLPKRRNTETE